jgi:DNA-binding MarR family transcriptional regulator
MVAAPRTVPTPLAAAREPELVLAESIHGLMRGVLHRVQPSLEAEGLSMGRFWLLHLVSSLPEASLTTVARHLAVSSPTACATLDGLVRSGLVHRRRSQRDRRVVELVPTAEGRRIEAVVWGAIGGALQEATESLSSREVAIAARTLAAIAAHFEAGPAGAAHGGAT